MRKVIAVIGLGVLVSFFFYPVDFTFLPGLNTKKILAALGVVIYGLNVIRKNDKGLTVDLLFTVFLAFAFSMSCFFSEVHAGVSDGSYTTYFVSFFVWILGAYAICFLMKKRHGVVSMRIITNYLAAVAVFQCFMSQLINRSVPVRVFVDRYFNQNQDMLHDMERLYGIGASLDSGGVRFAITLLMMAFFIYETSRKRGYRLEFSLLSVSFVVVTILGSVIARTTIVGTILGLIYIAILAIKNTSFTIRKAVLNSLLVIVLAAAVIVPLLSYLYLTNSILHEQLRFGFEGFFNWVETGQFQVDSIDKLNGTMWVWPKDSETWFVGTGLFGNWVYGTDIGYCRFIMYCGLLGFSLFSLFFIHNAASFNRKFKNVRFFSLFLLALTFVVWIKVATDIFQIYALLICADAVVFDSSELTEDTGSGDVDEEKEVEETVRKKSRKPIPKQLQA